jgi:hypothetical protein
MMMRLFIASSFRVGAEAPDPESRESGLDALNRPEMTDGETR